MKKDYSLIRLNFYQDMRSCFTLDVFNVRKWSQKENVLMQKKDKVNFLFLSGKVS
jgi:hypothetical protein